MSLKITEINVEHLTPNPWNPNRMSEPMRAKLKAYVERDGLVEPLVVRPRDEGYEILGGFHRWGIARELGYTSVPCVVVDVDDRRARILSINLNELKGQSLPALLAELIHDLSRDLSFEDLASQLPYDADELRDTLDLLKIPDGLEATLATEAEQQARDKPAVITFVVDDADTVEAAIEQMKARGIATRGGALVAMAREFLGKASWDAS